MKSKIINVVLILLLSFGLASISLAQVGRQTGTISGTVSDEEGNFLPGATVTLTGTGIMGSLTYVTGERGRFRFPSLIPGECEVKVEMPGFKTTVRGGLRVQVGKTIDIQIILSVTTIEEQVTVVATVPMVDIETSKTQISR